MKKYSLNGKWKMTGNGYAVEGTIPGSVYSFLYLDNKLLPDPYYRDNEDIYLELVNHEYAFEKTFGFTRPSCFPARKWERCKREALSIPKKVRSAKKKARGFA